MHPIERKWNALYVLSDGVTVRHLFGSEEHATDHIKSVFAGRTLLRRHGRDKKYTVYPTSSIVEVKVEPVSGEESSHHTGPFWNA